MADSSEAGTEDFDEFSLLLDERRLKSLLDTITIGGFGKNKKLKEACSKDKELKKILKDQHAAYAIIGQTSAKIQKRKTDIARKIGLTFDSIDKLACEHHPGIHFEITGTIDGAFIYTPRKDNKRELNTYQCIQCASEKHVPRTIAYDCPQCGIVLGDFEKKHYRSPEESWRALAGREGEHYHCTLCGIQIGEHYWKMS